MTEEKSNNSRVPGSGFMKENEMAEEEQVPRKLSRKDFVKGAAAVAGAGALASCAPAATPEPAPTCPAVPECPPAAECAPCPTPWLPEKWDEEADIVVVGTGMAGMSTAITAYDAGASVLMLEKMPQEQEGGNSAVCMQFIWAPKDLEDGIKYIEAMDCGMTDEEMYPIIAQGLVDNVTVIKELGGEIAPAQTGSAPFPELPGSSTYQTWAWTLDGETGVTGEGRLWQFFRDERDKRDIRVLYETPAQELIQDGATREILGVYATNGGTKLAIKAKKGVVLSCGGFEFGHDIQKQFFWGAPYYGLGTPGNTGDGIKMAVKAGADLWKMNEPNGGNPGVLKLSDTEVISLRVRGNSRIYVDKLGKRYTAESGWTRSHACGTLVFNFDPWALDWARIPTWVIFDDAVLNGGPMGGGKSMGPGGGKWTWFSFHGDYTWSEDNSAELEKGWILKADSIAELAAEIKADPDNGGRMDAAALDATIARYNEFCADGQDPDFRRTPDTLGAIQGPPYYAVKLWPSGANTMGGPRRNKLCQIVDPYKNPIGRLYGTGELGSFWGYTYSSGGNIGECLFSGRTAAQHAVALEPWE